MNKRLPEHAYLFVKHITSSVLRHNPAKTSRSSKRKFLPFILDIGQVLKKFLLK